MEHRAVDAYPLSSYFPPAPAGTEGPGWHPSALECLQGQIDGMPRDDDMDDPILNLTVAERTQNLTRLTRAGAVS